MPEESDRDPDAIWAQIAEDIIAAADDPDTDDDTEDRADWTEHGDVAAAHARYAARSDHNPDDVLVDDEEVIQTITEKADLSREEYLQLRQAIKNP